MKQNSITSKSTQRILLLSFMYASMLTGVMFIISSYVFESIKTKEINKAIISKFTDVSTIVKKESIYDILKQIQQANSLQEVFIFSENCQLLASSSLTWDKSYCRSENGSLIKVPLAFSNQKVTVAYEFHLNKLRLLKENFELAIIIFFSFQCTTFIVLYHFLNASLLRPLTSLSKLIQTEADPRGVFPKELGFLAHRLWQLKEEISKKEEERIFFELARTVVHDIRNPLSFVKQTLQEEPYDKTQIDSALKSVDFHINKLLAKTKDKSTTILDDPESWRKLIAEAANTIDINVQISISPEWRPGELPLSSFDLQNILLNLFKNSSEAGAKLVKVETTCIENILQISISDNGSGIPKSIQGKIFNRNFTSKSNGNGIGLSSINDLLSTLGGSITLDTKQVNGTTFKIELPLSPISCVEELVLVDDDKFIHASWHSAASKRSIKMHSYYSINDFFERHPHTNLHVPVYIDSSLKDNVQGEIASKDIWNFGYHNIFLSTGYTDLNLQKYPWLKGIQGKEFPLLS